VLAELSPDDLQYLLNRPEFRRFLYAAIQSAGILQHEGPAHGQTGRDLSYAEGRRSLGFDMLQAADRGQPEPLQSALGLATLDAVIREALNPPPKEKTRGRRNDDTARYDDIGDGD
jgi:hypothetical protein